VKRKIIMTSAAAAAAVLFTSGMAVTPSNATPSDGFVGTQISKGFFGPLSLNANKVQDKSDKWDFKLQTTGDSDLYVTRNAISAGGSSGWHTHPGPSLVTVTVGEIAVYDGDDPACPRTVYKAGQGSVDIGGGAVHLVRNESGAPAETVSVQMIPTGAARRIDAPKPTNCPD